MSDMNRQQRKLPNMNSYSNPELLQMREEIDRVMSGRNGGIHLHPRTTPVTPNLLQMADKALGQAQDEIKRLTEIINAQAVQIKAYEDGHQSHLRMLDDLEKGHEVHITRVNAESDTLFVKVHTEEEVQQILEQDRQALMEGYTKLVAPFHAADKDLEKLLLVIEAAAANVSVKQGRELLKAVETIGADATLRAAFTRYERTCRALHFPEQYIAAFKEVTDKYSDAIQYFINGDDNGESLRSVIKKYGNEIGQMMFDVRENINLGGRPIDPYRPHLADDWRKMEAQRSNATPREIVTLLLDLYETMPEPERRAWNGEAIKKLKTLKTRRQAYDFRLNLLTLGKTQTNV